MSQENNSKISVKIAKLNEIVGWFESDDFVLEEAIDHFKEAEQLAVEIENDLTTLKNEVVVLKKKFDED